MPLIIYALKDPRQLHAVRYVGFTAYGPRRLWEHINEAQKTTKASHKLNWIRSLLRDGIKPILETLEEVTYANWEERERYWIALYKQTLTNTTDGGEGLVNPSQEVRDAIAAKCRELSKGNSYRLGHTHSAEDRIRISEGIRSSEKHKAKVEAMKGKPIPHATEAARLANLGTAKTEEHRENIRAAMNNSDAVRAATKKRIGGKFINNGSQMKILLPGDIMPEGWRFGRLY